MIVFKFLLRRDGAYVLTRNADDIFRTILNNREDMVWIFIQSNWLVAQPLPIVVGRRPQIGIPSRKILSIKKRFPAFFPGGSTDSARGRKSGHPYHNKYQ